MHCPTSGKFACSKNICHNLHHIITKKTVSDNDYQLNILEEGIEKDDDCKTRLL